MWIFPLELGWLRRCGGPWGGYRHDQDEREGEGDGHQEPEEQPGSESEGEGQGIHSRKMLHRSLRKSNLHVAVRH